VSTIIAIERLAATVTMLQRDNFVLCLIATTPASGIAVTGESVCTDPQIDVTSIGTFV
jgi:hypothetical protein